MTENAIYIELIRAARAFILEALLLDSKSARSGSPRVRKPLTPTAKEIFRTLVFHFENLLTGLCNPAIATLALEAGCSQTSVTDLLKALKKQEYVTWRRGKRKRMRTRAGWRVVRSSNLYKILCPTKHLNALRRRLIQASGGKFGPIIQAIIHRFTPPSEEAEKTTKIIESLAADMRFTPKRTIPETAPASQSPLSKDGPVEVAGIRIEDPKLGGILAEIWKKMERQEP